MGRKIANTDDVWVDWLKDEPLPVRPDQKNPSGSNRSTLGGRDRLRNAGLGNQEYAAQTDGGAAVSIQIHMPSLHRPAWMRLPNWSKSQVRYWGVFVVIVVASGLMVRLGTQVALDKFAIKSGTTTGAGSQATGEDTKPAYSPIVPQDKKQLASQGEDAGRYDATKKLYSYNDATLGANLTISQQPLPDSFKKNPSEISKAADSIEAKHKIVTALGDAYLYTQDLDNGGTQRIVFTFNDRLVFVQSNKKLSDDAWKFYIENLR